MGLFFFFPHKYFCLLFSLGTKSKIVKPMCVYNMDMDSNQIYLKKRHAYL